MSRICSSCQQASPKHNFICSHCGAELVDNGELLSALDLNEAPARPKMISTLIVFIIIAILFFLAKLLL